MNKRIAEAGETLIGTCYAAGKPRPKVEWFSTGNIQEKVRYDSNRVFIEQVSLTDNGIVECHVKSKKKKKLTGIIINCNNSEFSSLFFLCS